VAAISQVFSHMRQFLADDARVFIVANDKLGLYPEIAMKAGYIINDIIKRAVTKRTEKGGDPYEESIFCLKKGETC